jgi:hypothetical protein
VSAVKTGKPYVSITVLDHTGPDGVDCRHGATLLSGEDLQEAVTAASGVAAPGQRVEFEIMGCSGDFFVGNWFTTDVNDPGIGPGKKMLLPPGMGIVVRQRGRAPICSLAPTQQHGTSRVASQGCGAARQTTRIVMCSPTFTMREAIDADPTASMFAGPEFAAERAINFYPAMRQMQALYADEGPALSPSISAGRPDWPASPPPSPSIPGSTAPRVSCRTVEPDRFIALVAKELKVDPGTAADAARDYGVGFRFGAPAMTETIAALNERGAGNLELVGALSRLVDATSDAHAAQIIRRLLDECTIALG